MANSPGLSRAPLILLAIFFSPTPALSAAQTVPTYPTPAARRAAVDIRRETLLPPSGPEGRPLPLVSHWNMGGGNAGTGWSPAYQIELLNAGHHILPWLGWPETDPFKTPATTARFERYYGPLLALCRELELPISFRGTQWEAMLLTKEYRGRPPETNPAVVTPSGEVLKLLDPFGPADPWKDTAREFVATPGMRKVQELYPAPPLVLFVSNNEAPDLRWHDIEKSRRYLERFGPGRTDEFKRKVTGDGWAALYPAMFGAMRDALANDAWKRAVRFVGYNAFGPSHFGRMDDWMKHSLYTQERTSPDYGIWDGGSPSYYTNNWNGISDHRVWSTQVESMNWIFMLEEAWRKNPALWWEISLWDGNRAWLPGKACNPTMVVDSKACQYLLEGQTYTPERYLGWAQFGLWLLRPRVVREFRLSEVPLAPWMPTFEKLLFAVDRVHASAELASFWRHGELVRNPAQLHPFQENIPERLAQIPRWFLLDTNLDRPRPWTLTTEIPVFALALVQGEAGHRRWLVYAHAPLGGQSNVEVTLPAFGKVTLDVPREGVSVVVDESNRSVKVVV